MAFVSHYFQNIDFVKYENHFFILSGIILVTPGACFVFQAKSGSNP